MHGQQNIKICRESVYTVCIRVTLFIYLDFQVLTTDLFYSCAPHFEKSSYCYAL